MSANDRRPASIEVRTFHRSADSSATVERETECVDLPVIHVGRGRRTFEDGC